MSTKAIGIQAYNTALQNFGTAEASLKQGTSPVSGTTFAQTLDQTLVRDSVDRGENFGAHADFIKTTQGTNISAVNHNSFTDTIQQSVNRLSALQAERDSAINEFASGRTQNVHELMITLQKASVAMSMTSAVRGKVLEAYKELSRIQF